jgi:hypothetical protein
LETVDQIMLQTSKIKHKIKIQTVQKLAFKLIGIFMTSEISKKMEEKAHKQKRTTHVFKDFEF